LFSISPRLFAWVASRDGRGLLGYATATSEYSTWNAREFLHMDCLFVKSGHRGAGIGAHLLASVLGFAHESGFKEAQWQTPHWNDDARRFYRRHGAVDHQKWRFVLSVLDSNPPRVSEQA
jgi:GNAT superfamily N-acetyltransferase